MGDYGRSKITSVTAYYYDDDGDLNEVIRPLDGSADADKVQLHAEAAQKRAESKVIQAQRQAQRAFRRGVNYGAK